MTQRSVRPQPTAAILKAEPHLTEGNHAYLLDASALSGIPGDFNRNGVVDAADYVVWRKNGGAQEEYDTWRANFGSSLGPGSGAALPSANPLSAAVPEPASVSLLMLAVLGFLPRRRF